MAKFPKNTTSWYNPATKTRDLWYVDATGKRTGLVDQNIAKDMFTKPAGVMPGQEALGLNNEGVTQNNTGDAGALPTFMSHRIRQTGNVAGAQRQPQPTGMIGQPAQNARQQIHTAYRGADGGGNTSVSAPQVVGTVGSFTGGQPDASAGIVESMIKKNMDSYVSHAGQPQPTGMIGQPAQNARQQTYGTNSALMKDWAGYFSTAEPGETRPWAGGTLTMGQYGQATYTDQSGKSVVFDVNTDPNALASQYPAIASEWNAKYLVEQPVNTVAPAAPGQIVNTPGSQRQIGPRPTYFNDGERYLHGGTTVSGLLESLLQKNNPLMKLQATRALDEMVGRGMQNSTMAIEAGQNAILDNALQIAGQDSQQANQYSLNEQQIQGQIRAMDRQGDINFGLQNDQQATDTLLQAMRGDQAVTLQQVQDAGSMERLRQETESTKYIKGLELGAEDREALVNATGPLGQQYQVSYTAIMTDPKLKPDMKEKLIQELNESYRSDVSNIYALYGYPIAWGDGGGDAATGGSTDAGGGYVSTLPLWQPSLSGGIVDAALQKNSVTDFYKGYDIKTPNNPFLSPTPVDGYLVYVDMAAEAGLAPVTFSEFSVGWANYQREMEKFK